MWAEKNKQTTEEHGHYKYSIIKSLAPWWNKREHLERDPNTYVTWIYDKGVTSRLQEKNELLFK